MAGIGFRLQKLLATDSFTAQLRAYSYSALIATGPMLVTLASLMVVHLITDTTLLSEARLFYGLVIYAYAFSLVLLGPWMYLITRFLGDKHYLQQFELFSGTYFFCLALLLPLHGFAAIVYLHGLGLPWVTIWLATTLFLALTGTWLAMPFLSAARHFQWIVGSYVLGGIVSVVCVWWQRQHPSVNSLLAAYGTGAMLTLLISCFRIIREFGTPHQWCSEVLRYLPRYPGLMATGLFFHAGLWIDRWIFWSTPHAEQILPGLRLFSDYDTPMFLAQLTTLPTMAYFLVQIETQFARRYHHYFATIRQRLSRRDILASKETMTRVILQSFQRFVLLQGICSGLLIIFIVPITDAFALNPAQVGIFRIGILGAFVFTGFIICLNFFFYFDWQREAVAGSACFFFMNLICTRLSLLFGFPAYGFGFAAASLLTFAVSIILLQRKLITLEYWIFMRQPIALPTFPMEGERMSD